MRFNKINKLVKGNKEALLKMLRHSATVDAMQYAQYYNGEEIVHRKTGHKYTFNNNYLQENSKCVVYLSGIDNGRGVPSDFFKSSVIATLGIETKCIVKPIKMKEVAYPPLRVGMKQVFSALLGLYSRFHHHNEHLDYYSLITKLYLL